MNSDEHPQHKGLFHHLEQAVGQKDADYIHNHPELAKLFSDFFTSMAEFKPQDYTKYTADYFSVFRQLKGKEELLPLLIIGPSGCGKETFHKRMRRIYPHYFEFSVSYTTRPKREGEVHGVNYFYITKEEFEQVGSLLTCRK